MFEKYSAKCLDFIIKNKLFTLNKKNILFNKIINLIFDKLDSLEKENNYFNPELLKKNKINKINNKNSLPILFNFLKKILIMNYLINIFD